MIAMVQQGRLGNQIFQYVALRSVARPRERLLLLGFRSLQEVLDGVEATFLPLENTPLRHLQSVDFATWGSRIRRLPHLGTMGEVDGRPSRPRPQALDIVEPSWFQTSAAVMSPELASLRVRESLVSRAHDVAREAGADLSLTAFVHVRAGDYRSWPSASSPAILPVDWYRARMQELREARPGIRFLALGDEPAYTALVAQGLDDVAVVSTDEATDFALMTLCSDGILSASSFAFWGAWFAHREAPQGTYLAPRYWAGHAASEWYPRQLEAAFLTYR